MQHCHWQEALSMITWVTEDLCISAQCSRQGEFSSLALHLCKPDMGCKTKQIYLAVSFYFYQAFTNPLHFTTSGWRSDSSPAVPTHHQCRKRTTTHFTQRPPVQDLLSSKQQFMRLWDPVRNSSQCWKIYKVDPTLQNFLFPSIEEHWEELWYQRKLWLYMILSFLTWTQTGAAEIDITGDTGWQKPKER